ncbi:MAG TPA: type VI secretion system contractile sheath large subunit, partial [Ignavibacteriaceae bacterium]|nr:type VI secretion system contractile sheath large subunit [Ignavibacteriaceae bacterium]
MAKEQTVSTETTQSSVDKLLSLLDESKKNAVVEFIGKVGKESQVFKITGALLDSYIADIDTVLSAQMDEIIHNQDFQELESTWTGLLFLVQNTEFSKPIKFELLDVTKEELYEDLN